MKKKTPGKFEFEDIEPYIFIVLLYMFVLIFLR